MDKALVYFAAIFHFIVIISVINIVRLTSCVPGYKYLLVSCTKENGFFEIGSFFILLSISLFCFYSLFRNYKNRRLIMKYYIFLIITGILSLAAAFEEISWGQHFLEFNTGDFFAAYNRQNETNLHNLISPVFFGFMINAFVYCIFIFLPIIIKFNKFDRIFKNHINIMEIFTPSIFNILMFCFAFSLQAYFLYETLSDTAALITALIFIAILILSRKKHRTFFNILHLLIIISAAIFFMVNYRVFSFENVQYEIREFVIMYAFLFWIINSNSRFMEYYYNTQPKR